MTIVVAMRMTDINGKHIQKFVRSAVLPGKR